MKPIPTDPLAANNCLIAALCEDLMTPEFMRTGRTPRADAVGEIVRQQREARRD